MGFVLLAALYLLVFVSQNPFAQSFDYSSGSLIRQGSWVSVALLGAFIVARNWPSARPALTGLWIILLPMSWLLLTTSWSLHSDLSIKRNILLAFMMLAAFGVASSRLTPSEFMKTTWATLGIIGLISALPLIVAPDLVRDADGDFVGMYSNKNLAGRSMAPIAIAFIFGAIHSTKPVHKAVLSVAAAFFFFLLIDSGSRTSLAAAIVAILFVPAWWWTFSLQSYARVVGQLGVLIVAIVPFLLMGFLGIGLRDVGEATVGDLTFTGRTDLWGYIAGMIQQRPLLGWGYGSIYSVPPDGSNALEFAREFAAGVTQGHNGYLDVILETGAIGLLLMLFPIIWLFRILIRRMATKHGKKENTVVYGFIFCILVFTLLHNGLESSLFRSSAALMMMFFITFFLAEFWRHRRRIARSSSSKRARSGRRHRSSGRRRSGARHEPRPATS